jgi:FlaA1/EpsC-like NDP-sugar epimerase
MHEGTDFDLLMLKNRFLNFRIILILLFKITVVVSSLYLAFLVRFDFSLDATQLETCRRIILPILIIKLAVFWSMGLSRGWWRYASLADALDILKATLLASLVVTLYLVFVYRLEGIPRSVILLDWLFTLCALAGARFFRRVVRERYVEIFPFLKGKSHDQINTLIIGAGETGQTIVREIRKNDQLKNRPVGFIDDDPKKDGGKFQGLPVLGTHKDIAKACKRFHVAEIIIAIPSATAQQMRTIVDSCQSSGVAFKTLPGVSDLIDGKVSIQQIRDVDVQDLLGRRPIQLDTSSIDSYLRGKTVLITGAAGSIGSEICRQVTRFGPAKIILFDIAESPLFHIEQELMEDFPDQNISAFICDVRDKSRTSAIIKRKKPEVIFHAAAYKHVPMMEKNPAEAAHTNVFGTRIIADVATEFGVETFVMISTDKAVNPTNVMGATKRAAEIYIQSLALQQNKTRFSTVRFGNVLGSAGSVVPIFKDQIKKGGPVKVTHPDITRFFMTIPEATQLVLQAGSMGEGGEIFLLDMGEPVKIVDLAEELIRLSGFTPYEDIEIEFTGLRPGEKLYEELLLAGENVKTTEHESIHVADAEHRDPAAVLALMEKLYVLQRNLDRKGLVNTLQEIVPEYTPDKNFWS